MEQKALSTYHVPNVVCQGLSLYLSSSPTPTYLLGVHHTLSRESSNLLKSLVILISSFTIQKQDQDGNNLESRKIKSELRSFSSFLDLNKLDGFGDSTKKDAEVSDSYQLDICTEIAFKIWLYCSLSRHTISSGSGIAKAAF